MNSICNPPSPLASDNEGEDRRVMDDKFKCRSYKLALAATLIFDKLQKILSS